LGVIFDTSVLIGLERTTSKLEDWIRGRENEPFGISAVTASEMLHGVHRAGSVKRRIVREAFVERILEVFPVYPFDLAAARIYAGVWSHLAEKGKIVGTHDLLIAATCMSLGFSLATLNRRDYDRIEGLSLSEL